MNDIVIRMIAIQDYKDVHNLNKQLGYEYDEQKVYKKIISILEAGSDILLVAECDGKVVGYAHGAPYETLYSDDLLNTICFCVDSELEAKEEIANQLYLSYEERAKRFGFKGIRLALDAQREQAHELFLRHGFQSHRSLQHFIKYFQ